jgi:cytochrome c553
MSFQPSQDIMNMTLRIRARVASALFLPLITALMSACGDGSDAAKPVAAASPPAASPSPPASAPAAATTPPLRLPIEVLGPSGYTETVAFELDQAAGIDRLAMQCHRCGWRDGTVQSGKDRGAKASVRLNGGAWIDVTDDAVQMQAPEKAFGGLSGGFHTTRFTLPISGAVMGMNKLEFRFNKNDGFTSGFRVLAFNLRDSSGRDALAAGSFVDDDPTRWTVQGTVTDVAEGKLLWQGKVALNESPLSPRALRASCSSCHAADGRDLKYFNYSDWSIQQRAIFHGLNEAQGRQIAAYIRSLGAPAPKQARPWNPPYQPGLGLDAKPVQEWAAGAGVSAVLERDADLLAHLLPQGTSDAEIARVANIKGTLNMRELPLPLQLPDWNAWLPDVHPLDVWGDGFANSEAAKAYAQSAQSLASGAAKLQDRSAVSAIEGLLSRTWSAVFPYMGGPVPCPIYIDAKAKGTATPSLMDQLPAGKTCEDGMQATNHWLAVKNWELFHTHGMEEATATLYPYGERRGWFGKQRNVFEVASHRSANNSHNFVHQSRALGSYHSNAWYQLQLVLNAGHRDPWTWFPQDWFYTPLFIALNSRDNQQPLAVLNTAMHIKMYQNLDMTGPDGKGADRGPDYNGWWLPFVQPWRFESTMGWEGAWSAWTGVSADGRTSKGFPWTQLDGYEPGLRVKVTNALLRQFVNKMKSYPPSALPRQADPAAMGGDRFEHADYVVATQVPPADQSCFYACPGEGYQARDLYRAMTRFKEMGVDATLRGEMVDWLKSVYANSKNNWDALR